MKFSDYKSTERASEGAGSRETGGIDPKMQKTLFDMLGKFEGKSEEDLVAQILSVARKQRKAGKLTDEDVNGFYDMLAPLLDDKKRKTLDRIVAEIKNIR